MLNRIEIQKKDGRVLTLPIYDPTSFQIKDIQGLDPVKSNIVTSNFSQMDGAQYQSSRREMRNIIFKLGIDTSNTYGSVKTLRKQLYDFMLPKTEVKIKFIQEGVPTLLIDGLVESFDSPLFVKDPEANISILCFDPDFYSEQTNLISGLSTSSEVNNETLYDGDVDSGFVFKLTAINTMNTFTLQNTLTDGNVRSMIFESLITPLLAGDILTISTIPGDKYVTVSRSGVESSMLWAIDPASEWIKLYPGVNKIRVSSYVTDSNYTIEYTSKHGGL